MHHINIKCTTDKVWNSFFFFICFCHSSFNLKYSKNYNIMMFYSSGHWLKTFGCGAERPWAKIADFSAYKSGMGENWQSQRIFFLLISHTSMQDVFFFLCFIKFCTSSHHHWLCLLLPHRFLDRMWAVSVPVWERPVYSLCVAVRRRHGLLRRERRDVLRWVSSHLRVTPAPCTTSVIVLWHVFVLMRARITTPTS